MANIDKIIDQIKELSVLEVADLVQKLEEEFGVSPMAMATPVAAAGSSEEEVVEEKDAYDIEITSAGDDRINVIKAIREFRQDLGLKDAKELVEGTPAVVGENIKTEEAKEIKDKLEEAGATVDLR